MPALQAYCSRITFILHIRASFTFMRSFDILTMVVLGGLGSMTGAITGAVLLTFISAYLAEYPEWRMIIYSITLIVLCFAVRRDCSVIRSSA